jgi:hypothetical protein
MTEQLLARASRTRRSSRLGAGMVSAAVILTMLGASSAQAVTSPKQQWGSNVGDDYFLANYSQTEAYFAKLATESDRLKILDVGKTVEGRDMQIIAVSSPENLAKLDHYKSISQRLARAEGLTDVQAQALADEGKSIVWIDAGIHTTEVAGTDQMLETVYQLLERNDPENQRLLQDVIILFAHCNPDGQEAVSNWYMRRKDPRTRVKEILPEFDKKWIGQESNRDYFMMNMPESEALGRALYIDWLPQITYNHHGATYPGAVVAAPPFRDPFNFTYDPLVMNGIDAVGAAMGTRWSAHDMPGATSRSGHPYSTWWNGGIRNTGYYHNQIGVLTEIMGYPTPVTMPLVPYRLQPKGENIFPVVSPKPGELWHYRRTIDYLVEANYAIIDYASKHRSEVLYNIYKMGQNSIKRGSEDYWTLYPKRGQEILDKVAADQAGKDATPASAVLARYSTNAALSAKAVPAKYFDQVMSDPALRDPRGFILPADAPDFATSVKFINTLIKAGVQVQKATAPFTVGGKAYPAGSYVVKTDQAFRPHVLDMFEPQDYPNDFPVAGGPPTPPYDSAGWTLAYEMGVKFDRVLEGFDGPFQKLAWGVQEKAPTGKVQGAGSAGWVLSPQQNDAFMLVNRLLKEGAPVYRLSKGADEALFGPGAFFVPASAKASSAVQKAVAEFGLTAEAVAAKPASPMTKIALPRVAVWEKYGGTTPGGWARWLLGQYGFGDNKVYASELDAGNLRKKYDVIVFASDAIQRPGLPDPLLVGNDHSGRIPPVEDVPAQYRAWLGSITAGKTIPQLKKFVEEGGTIITLGTSTSLAFHMGLPVEDLLTETQDGKTTLLTGDKFYIPGSILKVSIDQSQPSAWGMSDTADVFFDSGAKNPDFATPVFKLGQAAKDVGVKPIAWFSGSTPLRSGWAWGQERLDGGVAAFEAPMGKGKFYAFSPQIAFRGQTHGTYKLFFNSLYR